MTTTRRFNFEWPGPWRRGRYQRMQMRLNFLCHAYWWYEDGIIEGEPFERMQLSVTVSARDQWWCMQRALDLAVEIFAIAGIKRPPYPTWEPVDRPNRRSRYATPAEYVAASSERDGQ